jgi:hypothetical protein
MALINTGHGFVEMSDSEAQDKIRQTIDRHGSFILGCDTRPPIGSVQMYAGLPMRVVRHVTFAEAKAQEDRDIWPIVGPMEDFDGFYFEVVVAD